MSVRRPHSNNNLPHRLDCKHGSFSLDSRIPCVIQFFRERPDLSIVVSITSDTPLPTVVKYLAKHSSITDLTDELSRSLTVSPYAVARGGLSDVYRAARSDGTQVAIKCLRELDPKHVKRTARELNTWSKLKHRYILELYGLAVFQGCLAMVSPWMEYGSVNSLVKKQPNRDRYKLCRQLAFAVEYLHKEKVVRRIIFVRSAALNDDLTMQVHGDVKGDNVLVAQDGTLKLTDFGLSIMHDKAVEFSHTEPGGGTLRWMAPELFAEDAQRSFEADIYAMGMTMLEVITGEIPFRELKAAHSVSWAIVKERRTPEVPELQTKPVRRQATITLEVLRWCW
ncbi:hypothetical protein FRC07_002775, partial [Ceratobasidium sp. 392]